MKLTQSIQHQGGKRLLVPLVLRYVPEDAGRLPEPFAAALSKNFDNRRRIASESRGELPQP